MCRLSRNLGASTSWIPKGLSRPVMGLLYLYIANSGSDTHTHTPHHTNARAVRKFQFCYRNRHFQSSRPVFLNQSDARFRFQVRSYITCQCFKCEIFCSYNGDDGESSFRVTTTCSPVHRYSCTNVNGDTSCKKDS
jgi:hypothetical protein